MNVRDYPDYFVHQTEKLFGRDQLELLFLLFMVVLFLTYSYLTINLERVQSAVAPAIMLLVMFITLILIAFDKKSGGKIENSLRLGGTFQSDDEEEEGHGRIYEVHGKSVSKEMLYLVGYALSFVYIGFFTTNFVFAFLYIALKEGITEVHRRLVIAFIWASFVILLMFVLFDILLNARFIWTLGFLP